MEDNDWARLAGLFLLYWVNIVIILMLQSG